MSSMPLQFNKLNSYVKKHTDNFPKLVPALKALSEFVGHDDIKETVAKMVLFFISQYKIIKPLRRSKRKRKSRASRTNKRPRTISEIADDVTDDEDEEYIPDAKMALIALLTHTLQQSEDSSDDDEPDAFFPLEDSLTSNT